MSHVHVADDAANVFLFMNPQIEKRHRKLQGWWASPLVPETVLEDVRWQP